MRRKGDVPREMNTLLTDIMKEVQFQHGELQKQCQSIAQIEFSMMENKIRDIVSVEMTETEKKSQEEMEAAIQRDILSLKNSIIEFITSSLLNSKLE